MTRKAREAGVSPEPAINRHYLPLINHTSSDPSTILTAMSKAMTISRNAGRFKDVVPILGGMHFLEYYISSISTLGGTLGLHVLMNGAFGSVDTMLNGEEISTKCEGIEVSH